MQDFVSRTNVSKDVTENLILGGAFDWFSSNRRALIWELPQYYQNKQGSLFSEAPPVKSHIPDFAPFERWLKGVFCPAPRRPGAYPGFLPAAAAQNGFDQQSSCRPQRRSCADGGPSDPPPQAAHPQRQDSCFFDLRRRIRTHRMSRSLRMCTRNMPRSCTANPAFGVREYLPGDESEHATITATRIQALR